MSFFWAFAASIFVIAVTGVSAMANWTFGLSQGTEDTFKILFWDMNTAQLFGVASLAADGLKCTMLFGVTIGFMSRTWRGGIAGLVCGVIWVICLAWSWQSAVGFVAINHQKVIDVAGKSQDNWGDANVTLERLNQQRALVPVHRELEIVRDAIEGKRNDPVFVVTDNCRDATTPKSIRFCQEYRGLIAEETSASAAAKLDLKIEGLRHERRGIARVSVADPLAISLAKLTSTAEGEISTYRSWAFASILEFISALGLWSIWNSRGNEKLFPNGKRGAPEAVDLPFQMVVQPPAMKRSLPVLAAPSQEVNPTPPMVAVSAEEVNPTPAVMVPEAQKVMPTLPNAGEKKPVEAPSVKPSGAAHVRSTSPALRLVKTDRDLLREALKSLPCGIVYFAEIGKNLSARCTDNGVEMPAQQRITALLVDLGVKAAKRGSKGARYDNHLGLKEQNSQSAKVKRFVH